ncbi:MAG TPA: glycosyltransferase family 4 protein, partial [Verrucomicrobiae bacterium]|nr:glycosyltransferase family 4 protein [Verrucomicrobiae bacterium]
MNRKPCVLILVENLPVPLDRRVWQESCALRDAGYEVVVICPRMRGWTAPYELREGIHIYRHWISEEAGGLIGFIGEYASALWGEWTLAWKVWWRHRFRIIHLCNPPDLLFLVALPFKWLFMTKVIYDQHDAWPEMFEAKFGRRGWLYRSVRLAEWLTYRVADVAIATNESVRQLALERGGKRPEDVLMVRTAPKIGDLTLQPDESLRKGRKFLVGYIGVMGNADGVNYLIEAAGRLVHGLGRRDIQFLIMGSGPEYENLVRQRDAAGLRDHVDLPGRVTNEFLVAALKTIDLGVACDPINPYNDHCTMNKTLEYMAFGKAQVLFATREGRASAGDAALYVTENSAAKLAEGIAELLADPDRRARMGEIGRERL